MAVACLGAAVSKRHGNGVYLPTLVDIQREHSPKDCAGCNLSIHAALCCVPWGGWFAHAVASPGDLQQPLVASLAAEPGKPLTCSVLAAPCRLTRTRMCAYGCMAGTTLWLAAGSRGGVMQGSGHAKVGATASVGVLVQYHTARSGWQCAVQQQNGSGKAVRDAWQDYSNHHEGVEHGSSPARGCAGHVTKKFCCATGCRAVHLWGCRDSLTASGRQHLNCVTLSSS
jgi:hypothetical protein